LFEGFSSKITEKQKCIEEEQADDKGKVAEEEERIETLKY